MYPKDDNQDMRNICEDFQAIIDKSKSILITTHLYPDPDALASALSVYLLLKQKGIDSRIVLESKAPEGFKFLPSYEKIEESSILSAVKKYSVDLIIVCDVHEYKRFVFEDYDELREYIIKNKIKTVCIDHHEAIGKKEPYDLVLNWAMDFMSASETVYEIFIHKLKYNLDRDLAEVLMFGIIGDTGRFRFGNSKTYPHTFLIALSLLETGISIDQLVSKMNRFPISIMKVVSEFIKNTTLDDNFTYSYLSDEFCESDEFLKIKSDPNFKFARTYYTNSFLTSVEDNYFGFVVYKDPDDPSFYKGSFRSINGYLDTTVFAVKLGGGGLKPAAGFKVKAKDLKEAISIVKSVILENFESAKKSGAIIDADPSVASA
ncbi:DHH family phosphoesterase [Candidatus Dojkabacteria bacterium]|nr:DHH family phosphoesterase [Candidatus Dojkabacteria bacterium]